MNKRRLYFISILVILALAFLGTVSIAAEDSYTEELSFLSQLGITDGITKDGDAAITRAEFAAMTVRMINADSNAHKENVFRDINDSEFMNEICIARDLGIVSGTSDDTYSPDEHVAFPVAAKMMTSALGYGSWAEALGGYPTGYLKLASELDVLKGVNSGTGALRVNDAARLIYNALHANSAVITGIADDRLVIEEQAGKTPLSEKFKLKSVDGVVATANLYSISPGKGEAGTVTIGGKVLNANRDYSSYLALRSKAWYDEKTNTLAVIERLSTNRVEEINAENLSKGTGLTLLEYSADGSKSTSYRLDSGFTYVLNGRAASVDSASFSIKEGSYTLVDNDNDGDYDTVLAYKKDYFVIRSISEHVRTVYDNMSALKNICFDNQDSTDYELWFNDIRTYFGDLKENMVLEVYMSKDLKLCRIYASQNSIYGEISELDYDEGKLRVDDIWYDFNSYFEANVKNLTIGKSYELYLAPDGSVCISKEGTDGSVQYGYYLGYQTDGGLNANPKIKLLNINNEIKIYKLSTKLKLNDKKVSSTSNEIKAALIDSAHGNIPKYQLIKYSVSGDVVTLIQTATDYTGSWLDIPNQSGGNTFTKYMSTELLRYRSGNTAGAFPNAPLSKAIIFAAPYDVVMRVEGTSEFERTDKVYTKEYEDGYFRIWTTGNLTHDSGYYMDVFDYDEEMNPSVVVVYRTKNPSAVSTPSKWLDPQMVVDVVDAIDPDGMTSKKIKTYSRTGYTETFFDASLYSSIIANAGGLPTTGDVVRLATNTYGYITGMEIDIDYNSVAGDYTISTTDYLTTDNMNDEVAYISGEAVTKPGTFFAIEAKNNPNTLSSDKFNNVLNFRQTSPYYLIYNKSTGKVRLGNSGDIKAKAYSGEGSDVVLRNNYNCTIAVFVYED